MALRPDSGSWPPLTGLHDHTQTRHTRWNSSGRVISPTQRPVPDNTQHSQETDIYSPGGIRTPQSQEISGRRHTPSTWRPLGWARSNTSCA